jgi:hypothetical protein
MVSGRTVDQLRGNPDPAAGLADAAFQYVADAQFLGDFRNIDSLAFEGKGGVARHHRQRRNLRQIGGDVLADAVAEIFLLGVAAHVGEG